MKPADIRAEIARVRADVARQLEYLETLERALELLTTGLTKRNHYATIRSKMEANSAEIRKPRPGQKLRKVGPVATAALNANSSMFAIAEVLKEPYGTVKAWNRRKTAPDRIRSRLAEAPYLVPPDAWKP